MYSYVASANRIGHLVEVKQKQYGDSVTRTALALHALYPDGVPTEHFYDMLLVVRVLDKLARVSSMTRDSQDGESPWDDVCGYALLGQGAWYKQRGRPAEVCGETTTDGSGGRGDSGSPLQHGQGVDQERGTALDQTPEPVGCGYLTVAASDQS